MNLTIAPDHRLAETSGTIKLCNFFSYIEYRIYGFFKIFIYDSHTVREREREAETQAEGKAGSMPREPNMGLDPGSSRIAPWAKGRRQTAAPPRDP